MSINNQLNLNLLTNWFNQCTKYENDDQLEELVENTINNDNLINLINQLIEDKNYHEQYLEELCKHLFKLYLTKNDKLQLFVISFVPTLIGINLINSLDSKLKKIYNFIDVFLISIYNFSLINDDGTIKERSFRLPNLNKSSIYHFPEINNDLSEIAIRKLEKCYKENRILYVQDNVDQHYLNATNRMIVYCNLIQIYHDSISLLSKQSLSSFCRICNSILTYNNNNVDDLKLVNIKFDSNTSIDYIDLLKKSKPKLQFSSNFLLQLLNCLYFCVYNDVENKARECIIEIHKKAISYLYTDVLLMTNAIINSLSISKQSLEKECMGINIFKFTPNSEITTNTGQTKSAITNASFKTQKLPEDIEIKLPINNQDNLNPITEETTNDQEKSFTANNQSIQQTNQHNQSIKLATKENLNGFIKSTKEKDKKEKKKKRTKSSNLDDLNLQIINKNEQETLNEEEKVPLI